MNRATVIKHALEIIPIGALVLFIFLMWRVGNVQTWMLTDVIIITYAIGEVCQGYFVNQVESINRQAKERYGKPLLGRSWLFVGFIFGILIAGLVGTVVSTLVLVPSAENEGNAVLYTIDAVVTVFVAFLIKFMGYGPRWRKPSS